MAERIVRNSIRCNLCGDDIESTHRRDFRSCRCGKSMVDGGHDYLRRVGGDWTDTSIVERRFDFLEGLPDRARELADEIRSMATIYENRYVEHAIVDISGLRASIVENVATAITGPTRDTIRPFNDLTLPEPAAVGSVEGVMSGDPVVIGTRVLAETVIADIEAGTSAVQLRFDHPTLTDDAIAAVLEWHHFHGGQDLWSTPAGVGMRRWYRFTAMTLPQIREALGFHDLYSMLPLLNEQRLLFGERAGEVLLVPRRNVMKLKRIVDAVEPFQPRAGLRGGKPVERAIEMERKHWIGLIDDEDGTPARFEALARATERFASTSFMPRWEADSAFTPPNGVKLPLRLLVAWDDYARRWAGFRKVNPKIMIASLMGEISETHDSSSFPYGWAHKVKGWVDAGMPDPFPWRDRNGVDLGRLRRDMADAIARAGEGWVEAVGADGVELVWRTDGFADLILAGAVDDEDLPARRPARSIEEDDPDER